MTLTQSPNPQSKYPPGVLPRGAGRATGDLGAERHQEGLGEIRALLLSGTSTCADATRVCSEDVRHSQTGPKIQSGPGPKGRNQAPNGRSLVRDTNSVTPRQVGRGTRYKLRTSSRKALPHERVAKCGMPILGTVGIQHSDGRAHYNGIIRCGSVWNCPVCAAAISETRRQEVQEAIAEHEKRGGSVWMGTFTIPHNRDQHAAPLRSILANTWRSVIRGAPWKRLAARAGFCGYIKALELTHGSENGWHPHLHVLFFLDESASEGTAQLFGCELFERWSARISKAGLGECNPEVFRFERARTSKIAGDYVAKWGADREMTAGHRKTAKGGGRSPWQILDGISRGSKRDIMLFREYAAAFKGARQLTWSRGLRENYGLRDIASDDEAADSSERTT